MTIYVGNISFSMTEDDLKNVFANYGNVVSAKIITNKFNNRSKGYGFVEMENDAEGKQAIEALDQSEVMGRTIKVNQANPKKENFDA